MECKEQLRRIPVPRCLSRGSALSVFAARRQARRRPAGAGRGRVRMSPDHAARHHRHHTLLAISTK